MFFKHLFIQTAKDILIRWPKKVYYLFLLFFQYPYFKRKSKGRFLMKMQDFYPCLNDRVKSTPVDQHYINHTAWAARILSEVKPTLHIDISSLIYFSTILSAFVPVKFYDYRPVKLNLTNFESDFADLNQLPFVDGSIESISCMHTVEHIGLGRYGDILDPDGDINAVNELKRVTKLNGSILFVTPVGVPRIQFNAHRIYSYEQIVNYFYGFELMEFSLIPDDGGLIRNANPTLVKEQRYACGCFWFKKIQSL